MKVIQVSEYLLTYYIIIIYFSANVFGTLLEMARDYIEHGRLDGIIWTDGGMYVIFYLVYIFTIITMVVSRYRKKNREDDIDGEY